MGVDCFKTDFGERIPTDVQWFDGSDPQKMHNHYAYIYNELVWNVLKETVGQEEAVLFARSASVGAQKFPVHWGGDCYANYESMAQRSRLAIFRFVDGYPPCADFPLASCRRRYAARFRLMSRGRCRHPG
jgi:alpha-glucosidase (family GH31 glycosyl hydrolase)